MNYHQKVNEILTQALRDGAEVRTDARGIYLVTTCHRWYPEAVEIIYRIEDNGKLTFTRSDEHGRTIGMYQLGDSLSWEDMPVDVPESAALVISPEGTEVVFPDKESLFLCPTSITITMPNGGKIRLDTLISTFMGAE